MICKEMEWRDFEVADGLVLRLIASAKGLREIRFHPEQPPAEPAAADNGILAESRRQLQAYFRGELRRFELPIDLQGTEFQKRVWWHLESIPYGKVTTYAAVAQA